MRALSAFNGYLLLSNGKSFFFRAMLLVVDYRDVLIRITREIVDDGVEHSLTYRSKEIG